MSNLVILVKDQIGSAIVSKVASLLGVNEHVTSSAVDAFIPSLLSGVLDKGATSSGASSILDMISTHDLGGGVLDNLGDLLNGGSQTSSFVNMGAGLVSTLFGQSGGLLDKLVLVCGLSKGNTSSLLNILAPIALSVIGKVVKSKGLNASSLMSFFSDQKSNVNAALPVGFAAAAVPRVTQPVNNTSDDGGGMGWRKWLIPLLLICALAWYFLGKKEGTTDKAVDKMENVDSRKNAAKKGKKVDPHAGHNHAEGEHGQAKKPDNQFQRMNRTTYRIDPKGNVVDQYGFIVYSADDLKKDAKGNVVNSSGVVVIPVARLKAWKVTTVGKQSPQLAVDKNGNLVDGSGKILFKKGEFSAKDGYYVDASGKQIGFFKKIGKALGDAAEATADAFKDVFSKLFSRTDKTEAVYNITRMDFNKDDHRLTYYSKAEIMGLVEALKATPDAKVQVRVYTDDGQNEKENETLSENRANVVRDMMSTLLGQHKKQISFKGMGSSDAAKASRDAVQVVVE